MPKMITLTPKFYDQSEAEQVKHLHKLASSLNEALDMMQNERNALQAKVAVVEAQLKSCEQNLEIQKTIVTNSITQDNAKNQAQIETIQELRIRVRAQDEVIERLNGNAS